MTGQEPGNSSFVLEGLCRHIVCKCGAGVMQPLAREEIALDVFAPPRRVKEEMRAGNRVTTAADEFFGSSSVLGTHAEDAQSDMIIQCDNLHKTYLLGVEGVPALRGVTMSIKRGEFVCIFGTSGGGKSTLLNVLGTIDKPTRGHLKLCDVKIGNSTPDAVLSDIRLNKLGFVFQQFNLLGALTALENVEMPMILAGVLSASERRKRAKELLTAVGMEKRFDHVSVVGTFDSYRASGHSFFLPLKVPAQLSGGEQQRVTIARSIANSPEVLLLDEPTGDLDSVSTLRVMSLLTRLNKVSKSREGRKKPVSLLFFLLLFRSKASLSSWSRMILASSTLQIAFSGCGMESCSVWKLCRKKNALKCTQTLLETLRPSICPVAVHLAVR